LSLSRIVALGLSAATVQQAILPILDGLFNLANQYSVRFDFVILVEDGLEVSPLAIYFGVFLQPNSTDRRHIVLPSQYSDLGRTPDVL
jgi:hypothetical protein